MNVRAQVALEWLIVRLDRAPAAYQAAMVKTFEGIADYLYEKVYANLSGEVLNVKTGELRASIRRDVVEYQSSVTARVYSDGSVPYARIQEKGGTTRPHDIVVDKARALHFEWRGESVFFGRVHHPGSVIPASMYLRRVLMSERGAINRMAREGFFQAGKGAMG